MQNIPMYELTTLCFPLFDWTFGLFPLLAIMNNTATDSHVQPLITFVPIGKFILGFL